MLTYLLPADRVRAILIMGTVVLFTVPFVVITLRCRRVAPVASLLGLIFGVSFVFFEISHRSMDFFVVGERWANQFAHASSGAERETILQRFALWNEMARGWFFPLMFSYFLSSCCFAVATWKSRGASRWYLLAPLAFVLNALRLMGRMPSNYAGQAWLDGLNDVLYFPAVLVIITPLMLWFFFLAREENLADEAA